MLKVLMCLFFMLCIGHLAAKHNDGNPKKVLTKDHQELIWAHKNRSIERLAFSSGGAKGSAYPGVLKALELTQILKAIEKVAGSSAGAINAALIAVGTDTKVLYKDFRK